MASVWVVHVQAGGTHKTQPVQSWLLSQKSVPLSITVGSVALNPPSLPKIVEFLNYKQTSLPMAQALARAFSLLFPTKEHVPSCERQPCTVAGLIS